MRRSRHGSGRGVMFESMEARVVLTASPGAAVLAYAGYNNDADAAIYELAPGGEWSEVSLPLVPGSPDFLWEHVGWVDPDNGRPFAAGLSDEGLILYTKTDDGIWGQRNLTDSIPGAEPIDYELKAMTDAGGAFHLIGFTEGDDAVRYSLMNGSDRWTFRNITRADLAATGQFIPYIESELTVYATGWNGLNAAGIDPSGEVWSIWWAPGLQNWMSSNLTEVTGSSARFTGRLTVYTTPWNGINIAGVGEDGRLRVVWWVPEFGGEWRESNLTDLFGGPRLNPWSITSYVTEWGGLNVAGFDDLAGELVQYWWAPGMDLWEVAPIGDVAGVEPVRDPADVRGVSGLDGSLNLMVIHVEGDDIVVDRAFWKPGMAAWDATRVSDVARPIAQDFGVVSDHGYAYAYEYEQEHGDTVTGASGDDALSELFQMFQDFWSRFGAGVPGGGAFWYDTGYSARYVPEQWAAPSHTMDFGNYGSSGPSDWTSFNAGRELTFDLGFENIATGFQSSWH